MPWHPSLGTIRSHSKLFCWLGETLAQSGCQYHLQCRQPADSQCQTQEEAGLSQEGSRKASSGSLAAWQAEESGPPVPPARGANPSRSPLPWPAPCLAHWAEKPQITVKAPGTSKGGRGPQAPPSQGNKEGLGQNPTVPISDCPQVPPRSWTYLLPVVDDMHALQIDGHSHWLSTTPVQKALGRLINLTVEEGTPVERSWC